MSTFRNKWKLAAVTRETQKEHPRNGQSRNASVPRFNLKCITQLYVEIKCKVFKKLSQEFSRTESHILGALSELNFFRTHRYGRTPEPFREHSALQRWKKKDQMRIVSRMMLILKWDPPSASPVIQVILTQSRLPTLVGVIWSIILCRLPLRNHFFRMRITLGAVLIRSLVFSIRFKGRLRSGSGVASFSAFRRNSSNRDRAPKMQLSVLLNSSDKFVVNPLWLSLRLAWYNPTASWEHLCPVPGSS